MACEEPKPVYVPHSRWGISAAVSQGDGYAIAVEWTQAFPLTNAYGVVYNIYYSTIMKDVFTEGVKFVSVDGSLKALIPELTPGELYYFAVRAALYDKTWFNPSQLPDGFPGLKVYPEALLLADITASSTIIEISDIEQFPNSGIVQLGYEFVRYSSRNIISNRLFVSDSTTDRGFINTNARPHAVDGYDGVEQHDPIVRFWRSYEDGNFTILQATANLAYPNYAWTAADGYRKIDTDDLNTDLSASDSSNIDFPSYDGVGWHRTDPVALLMGDCVGTYYGGERYCADGYGVGFQLRGMPLGDESSQRLEQLLNIEGEPVVLLRRLYKGVTCHCMKQTAQNPSLRCPTCLGVGWVGGYDQYYNPRRSDGRILVRFDPTEEDIRLDEEGFESAFLPNSWTLVVPSLKSRDVLIRFNEDGTEEFRYEVQKVTRNKLIQSLSGAQKFSLMRLRKTAPPYQYRSFRNTATQPQTIFTDIGVTDRILPHMHSVVINENIINLSQVNETTGITNGHSHPIINGIVQPVMGHTHSIILP